MRLLIILLLAVNCATFFWLQHAQSATSESQLVYTPFDPNSPSIVLLDEPEEQAVVKADSQLGDSKPGDGKPDDSKQGDSQSNVSEQQLVDLAQSATQSVEQAVAKPSEKAVESNQLVASVVSSIPQSSTEPERVSVNPSPSKKALNSIASISKDAATKTVSLDFAEDGALCWFVDFDDAGVIQRDSGRQTQLGAISEYFSSLGVQAELVSVKVPKVDKHIIYLPARESSKQALADLKDLLKKGYDAFVFREGEFRNAISLGFYRNRVLAKEMQGKFQDEGLDARLSPWKTYKVDKKLRIVSDEGRGFAKLWGGVENEWQGARREKKYCNSVVAQG